MTTNATHLRAYMLAYGLTYKKAATLLGVSLHTVRSWLIHSESDKFRPMSDARLDYLRLILKTRKRVK